MILLVLMSFILIAGYVFAMIKKMKEIPYSIIETYYALMHKFWFTASLGSFGSKHGEQSVSCIPFGCRDGYTWCISQFQNRTKSSSLYRCRHVFNFFPDMGRLQ